MTMELITNTLSITSKILEIIQNATQTDHR